MVVHIMDQPELQVGRGSLPGLTAAVLFGAAGANCSIAPSPGARTDNAHCLPRTVPRRRRERGPSLLSWRPPGSWRNRFTRKHVSGGAVCPPAFMPLPSALWPALSPTFASAVLSLVCRPLRQAVRPGRVCRVWRPVQAPAVQGPAGGQRGAGGAITRAVGSKRRAALRRRQAVFGLSQRAAPLCRLRCAPRAA